MKVYVGIFGWGEINKADYDDALNNLKKQVRVIHTALEGKKWLLGDELSVADIIVGHTLLYAFQTVLDAGFRKSVKNVESWATSLFDLPEMIKVHGKVIMASKPIKAVTTEPKKEEPKKKEQPK